MKLRVIRIISALLAALFILSLAACSGGDKPVNADPTEPPAAEATAVPTEAPTPEPTLEPGEGRQVDGYRFTAVTRPGELKVMRVMLPLPEDDNYEREYFSFYFDPLPEYDEAHESDYKVDGKLLYFSLYNSKLRQSWSTRAAASETDFKYVWEHVAEIEYGPLPEGTYDPDFPETWLYISFVNDDGTVDYFGLGRDNYIFRATLSSVEAIEYFRFTQRSVEPVSELVHIHLLAEVFWYLHQEREYQGYYGADTFGHEYAKVYLACSEKTLLLEDAEDIAAFDALLTSVRSGDGSEEPLYLKEFTGLSVPGSASELPEGSLRVVLMQPGTDPDPENIKWGFYITPEGEAYNVMEPFAISDYVNYYYQLSCGVITKTPDAFDYAAIRAFFDSRAK